MSNQNTNQNAILHMVIFFSSALGYCTAELHVLSWRRHTSVEIVFSDTAESTSNFGGRYLSTSKTADRRMKGKQNLALKGTIIILGGYRLR